MKLNQKAVSFAKDLIKEGKYEPGDGDWSTHQPDEEKENQYIVDNGWKEFGRWFLGIEEDGDEDEKETYSFPYGDFEKVHKGGLIAIKQTAAQYEHYKIEEVAGTLIKLIEKKEENNG